MQKRYQVRCDYDNDGSYYIDGIWADLDVGYATLDEAKQYIREILESRIQTVNEITVENFQQIRFVYKHNHLGAAPTKIYVEPKTEEDALKPELSYPNNYDRYSHVAYLTKEDCEAAYQEYMKTYVKPPEPPRPPFDYKLVNSFHITPSGLSPDESIDFSACSGCGPVTPFSPEEKDDIYELLEEFQTGETDWGIPIYRLSFKEVIKMMTIQHFLSDQKEPVTKLDFIKHLYAGDLDNTLTLFCRKFHVICTNSNTWISIAKYLPVTLEFTHSYA